MLSCEKSVGGIPTKRTLSLQRRQPKSLPSVSRFVRWSSVPPLAACASHLVRFPDVYRRRSPLRIVHETTVPEERDEPPEQHKSLRARLEPTSTQSLPPPPHRHTSRGLCSPVSNMWIYFIQPFPSGIGLNYSCRLDCPGRSVRGANHAEWKPRRVTHTYTPLVRLIANESLVTRFRQTNQPRVVISAVIVDQHTDHAPTHIEGHS